MKKNTATNEQEIIETIQEAIEVQQKYAAALQELREENQFLADTILNNKLGKITTERRELLAKVRSAQSESKRATAELESIKSEYDSKLTNVSSLFTEIKAKKANIDTFITAETDKKIADIKSEYEKKKKANDKALAKHIAQNDRILQEQLNKYKLQHKIFIICGIAGVIVGVLEILF